MIGKIFFRLLFGAISIFLLLVIALATCGWLATQPAQFYTKLLEQKFSQDEQRTAEAHFEQLGFVLESWAEQAAILRQQNSSQSEKTKAANKLATVSQFAKMNELIGIGDRIVIDQDRINAVFSTSDSAQNGIKKLRIMLAEDRIKLAGELSLPDLANLYLSVDVRPSITPDGNLKLDLLSGRIGKLPIPLTTLLSWLPGELTKHKDDVLLDADASPANIVFRFNEPDQNVPKVKQICSDKQKLFLLLEAPVLSF